MKEIPLTLPEIGMINSTRFIIGTGVGLLLAGALDRHARKAVGFALIAVGSLVSIPDSDGIPWQATRQPSAG